jgi:hypothetical protein
VRALAALALVVGGCCTTPEPVRVPVSGCRLTRPLPVPAPIHGTGRPACPAPFEVCLTKPDNDALVLWKHLADDWMTAAWEKCQ